MIVDLTRGRGFPSVLYDTVHDTLSTQTRPEFGGRAAEYWRPHPSHPGLIVGCVRDEHEVQEEYDDPVRLEPFDCAVTLKLLRASQEPRWDEARTVELHEMNTGVYYGVPDMGLVHEMADAIRLLGEWFAGKQLQLFGR